MRILIYPHKQSIIPFHLLYGLLELGVEAYWFGNPSIWPAYLKPISRRILDHQYRGQDYDYILYADRISVNLPGDKILLDTLDDPSVDEESLAKCSLYLKCQYKIGEGYPEKVHPFPYSTFRFPRKTSTPKPTRDVFFLGWDSGGDSQRREIVKTLRRGQREGRFNFTGGLFEREELFQRNTPHELLHKPIKPLSLYESTCKDFKINLATESNGGISFRHYELLSWGCFTMVEEPTVPLLPRNPINHSEVVYFKKDLSDLLDLCCYYLEHEGERVNIAKRGYDLYWNHLTPCNMALYLMSLLEKKNAAI